METDTHISDQMDITNDSNPTSKELPAEFKGDTVATTDTNKHLIIPKGIPPPSFYLKPEELDVRNWRDYKDKDGKVYYYNRKTKKSQWRIPFGYIKLSPKDRLRPISSKQIGKSEWKIVTTFAGQVYYYNFVTGLTTWKLPEDFYNNVVINEAEEETKPVKHEPTQPIENKVNNGQDSESEVDEESGESSFEDEIDPIPSDNEIEEVNSDIDSHEDDTLTLDRLKAMSHQEQIDHFNEMLKELDVDRHSSWTTIHPKVISDIRFNAISSIVEKRAIVENYIKTLKKEFKKQKKERRKTLQDDFFTLVDEALKNDRHISFRDFVRQFSDRKQFKALKNEHESLFNNRKDQARQKRKEDFKKAEEEFISLLQDHVADIITESPSLHWEDIKNDLRDDPRYHLDTLMREDRANLFYDFKKSMRTYRNRNDLNNHKHIKEATRQKSIMDRRNRELKIKHLKATEEAHFKALLAEYVKSPSKPWAYWSEELERDPRFHAKYLSASDKEHLFSQRVDSILDFKETNFLQLLRENGQISISTSWDEAKEILSSDSRYISLNDEERRVLIFKKYISDSKSKMERDLITLLDETKINPKINIHEKKERTDLIELIRGDHRWRQLEPFHEMRQSIFEKYISDLKLREGIGMSSQHHDDIENESD